MPYNSNFNFSPNFNYTLGSSPYGNNTYNNSALYSVSSTYASCPACRSGSSIYNTTPYGVTPFKIF